MRIQPRASIAVLVVVIYAAIVTSLWLVLGVDYTTISESTENVVRALVVPIGVGAVFLAVTTTYLGWWDPVLREKHRIPRWIWVLVPSMILASLGVLLPAEFGNVTGTFIATVALGTLLVGFSEETLTRGVAVVALRARFGEIGVWFFSSLLFSCIHLLNLLFGQDVQTTLTQFLFTFGFGSVLYLVRRVSGTLILCMALHALWDFSLFVPEAAGSDGGSFWGLLSAFQVITPIIGLVALVLVLRRDVKKNANA